MVGRKSLRMDIWDIVTIHFYCECPAYPLLTVQGTWIPMPYNQGKPMGFLGSMLEHNGWRQSGHTLDTYHRLIGGNNAE